VVRDPPSAVIATIIRPRATEHPESQLKAAE
jgi:hypothetical protein